MMVPMQTGTKEPVLWPVSITEKRKQFLKKSLFWGAPNSLQMVTAAMKLKDAYSLEEKLGPT